MRRFHAWLVLSVLILPTALFAQQAAFSAIPRKYQLYPRDANDSAAVSIAGSVTTAGFDSIAMTVYKNGAQYKHAAQVLSYTNGAAPFSLSSKIHAELANYKIEIRVNTGIIGTADSVVCGDAFFIEGQSNSVSYATTGDMSPWVRSFGNTAVATDAGNTATIISDTVWGIGQCAGYNDPKWFSFAQMHCAVGVWGMQIGRHIVQDHGIPVCIINGAVGGSDISVHLRNMSTSSVYGAVYYRVTRAGLLAGLKGIFWEQGESDWIDAYHAGLYKAGFNSLYSAWKGDYPGLRHVYIFQVRPSSGPPEIVCETQRQTPQGRTDLSVMSTTGVVGYGGLHYGANGYQEFGDRIYRLVSRDFYASTDTVNITPPNIRNASFTDASHMQLLLQFDGPVLVPATANMKSYFALDSVPGLVVSAAADTIKHTLTLNLLSASNAAKVSCLPGGNYPVGGTAAEGPCLSNPRGIGALSFHNFPIAGQTIAVRRPEVGDARLSAESGPAAQSRFTILGNNRRALGNPGNVYNRAAEYYDIRGIIIGRSTAGSTGMVNLDKNKNYLKPVVVRTR